MVSFIDYVLLRLFTILLVLSIFLSPKISLGNDSAACIGMGGLVFQKNDQIKMLNINIFEYTTRKSNEIPPWFAYSPTVI